MNWMANSKSRIQKRKSTSVNLQRNFFASHNKKPANIDPQSNQRRLEPQSQKNQRGSPTFMNSRISQQQIIVDKQRPRKSCSDIEKGNADGSQREVFWPNYNRFCKVQESHPRQAIKSGDTPRSKGVFAETSTKAVALSDRMSKTLSAYPTKNQDEISNVRAERYCCCDQRNAMEEILRLNQVISGQKCEIKRLQEKLLVYEKEPCAGGLIKGCDSGGSPSLLAAAEGFIAQNINTNRDRISNSSKTPWISKNDEARVTINICAGTISYNSYPSRNVPNISGIQFVTEQSTTDYKLVNCSLNNHFSVESQHLLEPKDFYIGHSISRSGEKESQHFGAASRIELLNE